MIVCLNLTVIFKLINFKSRDLINAYGYGLLAYG